MEGGSKKPFGEVVILTKNPGKMRELTLLLSPFFQRVLPPPVSHVSPEERGETFEENCLLKLLSGPEGVWLVAEDSGLQVFALNLWPGVKSARVADSDRERIERLLERMEGVEDRRARFVCVAGLRTPGGDVHLFRGEVQGEILKERRGTGGFGYDPVFYYPPLGRSFAELSSDEKNEVSHRGRALRKLLDFLRLAAENGRCFT